MVVKTREKLIEVARQLFVHKGLENTTMNDIANASEKGRRTIYTYFRNKKEIYNAVIEAEADKMTAQLKAIASTGTRPAYVSEEVAAVMAAADGFPTDETTAAALLPTAIALEWPVGEGVNEIKTIVNEEHSLIMTRELSIEEGIAEMQERAAEFIAK